MSDRASRKPEKKQTPDGKLRGGISEQWDQYLQSRSADFQKMTQRRGAPMTYGGGNREKQSRR